MTLRELYEKRMKLVAAARERLDQINKNTVESRAAELEAQHDAAMAELDALDAQIEREKRQEEAERRSQELEEQRRAERRPAPDNAEGRGQEHEEGGSIEYEDVFTRAIQFGAASLNAEERAVLMHGSTDIPEEIRAQSVGTDSAGGYTVPEGFSGEIDRAMAAWGPMWDADIVRELNTNTGNHLPWPTVDDTANTGRIIAENAAADDDGSDDVAFGEKTLDAYVYNTGIVRMPLILLTDSAFDIEALVDDLFGERLGRTANQVLTTGTGSSQPNGIVTASSQGKAAASASALASDEVIDLLHSVNPAYRQSPKCRWQFNDDTLALIRKLKDGQGNYLWTAGDVRAGEPDTILAHKYSVNMAMANVATGTKPIIFGDHSRYVVRKVKGFVVITLRERYAENFQIGMIGHKRFDGELLNTAAVKHMVMA